MNIYYSRPFKYAKQLIYMHGQYLVQCLARFSVGLLFSLHEKTWKQVNKYALCWFDLVSYCEPAF